MKKKFNTAGEMVQWIHRNTGEQFKNELILKGVRSEINNGDGKYEIDVNEFHLLQPIDTGMSFVKKMPKPDNDKSGHEHYF
jgi:hypothetical protein